MDKGLGWCQSEGEDEPGRGSRCSVKNTGPALDFLFWKFPCLCSLDNYSCQN